MASKKKVNHSLSFDTPDFNRQVFFQPPDQMLPDVGEWRLPTWEELPSWRNAKRVSIDIECRDPDLHKLGPGVRRSKDENYIVGVGFAIEDGPDFYLPFRHHGGGNLEEEAVRSYLHQNLKDFKGVVVGNGLTYDGDWLAEWLPDDNILKKEWMDVQAIDVLLNELHDKYNLDIMCHRHGLPGKDERVLRQAAEAHRIDPKKDMWKLHSKFVDRYCRVDARRPLQLLRRQETELARQDSEDGAEGRRSLAHIWKIERAITPILVKLRRRGIRVDVDKLDHVESRAIQEETENLTRVTHATGVRLDISDIWKPEALARALKVAGYEPDKTQGTWNGEEFVNQKDSVDKSFLDKCGDIGKWIKNAREWNKLRTTFVRQVRDHIIDHGDDNYRVHCSFHQLRTNPQDGDGDGRGVRYGRFSSTDFNIQQQPVRHKAFGKLWRSVFIADKGKRWATSDWSQQEPRIAVHYAEIIEKATRGRACPGAGAFASQYRLNPALDIHSELARISGIDRTTVKNYVNGSLYGMGDTKLCKAILCETIMAERKIRGEWRTVEVPGPEGAAKIKEFYRFAPWIKDLTREAAKQCKKNGGFVRTSDGRKCRFVILPNGEIDKQHKAFNRIGQGEAAGQMKETLIEVDREYPDLVQATIHDEFDFSFDDIKVARRVKEMQMHVRHYNVPMKCDLEIGDNWGEQTLDEEIAA